MGCYRRGIEAESRTKADAEAAAKRTGNVQVLVVNAMKSSSDERAQTPHPRALAACVASAGRNLARNLAQWVRVLGRRPRAQLPPVPQTATVSIVLALIATGASMFLVDRAATEWAHHLPQWFEATFEQITNGGYSTWFLVPTGVIVLAMAAAASPALPRLTQGVLAMLAARCGYLFLAIALPGLFTAIIKRLIGRARPYMDINGDPFTFKLLVWRPEYASLPSGHSATVGAAAMAIGAIWPRTRPVMWLYALLIMFSRVVVLSHHPSDAIAGALVGAVGAAMVRRYFAARRLVFSARNLAVLPGPSLSRIWAAIRRAVFWPAAAKALEFRPD
jgi:membrane-associated phospholipid phosphatase